MKLLVQKSSPDDVYQGMVRIPEKYRTDRKGKLVPEGVVCELTAPGLGAVLVSVRGKQSSDHAEIFIDEATRNRLNLQVGAEHDLSLRQVGFIGDIWWAVKAADPAYRVPA